MKLSIVIVNYKVPHLLLQCLDAVRHSLLEFQADAEVFVVDNASHDGSQALVAQYFPTIHYIANEQNLGFAKANNIAIAQAHGDYVLLLNPDTIIPESFLSEICDFADTATQFGAAGVRMINLHGKFLPESKRALPSIKAALGKVMGFSLSQNPYYCTQVRDKELGEVPILSGACMLLNKKELGELALLDERYFMFGEDIDLSYSIYQAGYKNYYLPCTILHYKGESTDVTSKSYRKNFYGAMALFYQKYYPSQWGRHVGPWAIHMLCRLMQFKKHRPLVPKNLPVKTLNAERLTYAQIIKTIEQEGSHYQIQIEHPSMGFTI